MTPANLTEMTDAPPGLGLQPSQLRNTAVMTRPRRRAFPGRPEQVAHAHRFVTETLDCCPAVEQAVLCVSELAANAVAHTASGNGGEFEIIVCRGRASVLIAVYDDGSASPPAVRGLDTTSEDGRGLVVVAITASRWGHFGGQSGRVVWFELCWDFSLSDDTRQASPTPAALAVHIPATNATGTHSAD
jgi:serine/threonine-protein kinase RsbW